MDIRDVSRCLEQCCDNCLNISSRNFKNDHMSKSVGHCSTEDHERFEFFSDFTCETKLSTLAQSVQKLQAKTFRELRKFSWKL